ncbi:MAG TPA: galactokinase family protein [Acidimicrobiia bacterium]|jgi:galactokinase
MESDERHWGAVRAPARVNLIGEHTDYQQGLCLPIAIDREVVIQWRRNISPSDPRCAEVPIAIDRHCVVTARPAGTGFVRASSQELAGTVTCRIDGTDDPARCQPRWGAYVAGAVQAMVARGATLPGADLSVSSSVPPGSGLSSSSALSVALVLALAGLAGTELARRDVAHAALDAEVRATGVRGGLMDQLASLFGVTGHALLIDCRDLSVEPIPLPRDVAVLVAHCGVPRTLAGTEYGARRSATERAAAALGVRALRDASLEQVHDDRYARHVVTENARVERFADALRAGDIPTLGPLLLESHASLRDDFEVSTPELDALVDAFADSGALGARLTGAGFGGCVVALAARSGADEVAARTARRYRELAGRAAEPFTVAAVDGAGPTSSPAARPSSSRTPPR